MSTEPKILIHAEAIAADMTPYLQELFEIAEEARRGPGIDEEMDALWNYANESMDEVKRNTLRFPEPSSNAEAQRLVERLMTRWNLRGLIWGELDLRARVDEVLDEHEATFILPEGVTRDDVVKKAQEMPSWEKEKWEDSSNEQWMMMADAADEAFRALGAKPVDRSYEA